jgi:hypothetical protein
MNFHGHGFGLFWCLAFASLFMVTPLLMLIFGIQMPILLVFIIGASSVIVDEILTKIALRLGCKESNPFYNLLKKKIEERSAHALITIMGISMLLVLTLLYNSVLLLLIFVLGFTIPVFANALTLYGKICSNKAYNSDIGKPPDA